MDIIQPPSSDIIPASVLTTLGDIIVRGVAAPARLGIGTAKQLLRVNAGVTGLEYGNPLGTARKILRINDAATDEGYEELSTILRRAIMIRDTSAQSLANLSETVLDFNNAYSDINSMCDLANNKIIPNIPGFYLCSMRIILDNVVPVGGYELRLYCNAVVVDMHEFAVTGVSVDKLTLLANTLVYVNGTTDFLKASVYQGSGSPVNTKYGLDKFRMIVVGPF